MKQVLQHPRTGVVSVQEVPEPRVRRGGVLIDTLASLISVGTERQTLELGRKSLLGKARSRPDLVREVLKKVQREGVPSTVAAVWNRLETQSPLGYSSAGTVVESSAEAKEFRPGQMVAAAGAGYATHAERVAVPRNLVTHVPDGVTPIEACFATVGAIALHGVRTADVRMGDRVAVVGLGLIGQLTAQLLQAAGCHVVGIDLDARKLRIAEELGCELLVARDADVEAACADFTEGVGVDAAILTASTSSNDPLELAATIARDRATVVVVGAVGMEVPRRPFYDKELDLRLARSYGPGRYDSTYEEKGIDYPVGYVRWTERRNLAEFLRQVSQGRVKVRPLITHQYQIDEAEKAYEVVSNAGSDVVLGVVLEYPGVTEASRTPTVRSAATSTRGRPTGAIGVAVVGAGNFARTVLLPRIARRGDVRLVGVATSKGATAADAARRFPFEVTTTDAATLMDRDDVDCVVIATRHGSHALLSTAALRAGKAVFVEKPLAISEEDLATVVDAVRETDGRLFVGFNRRFSPFARRAQEFFAPATPLAMVYRVNAGPVPREHWTQDIGEGGGRVIGEACHFLDLMQYLCRNAPVEVTAAAADLMDRREQRDTVGATVTFGGGSIGLLAYFANGDKTLPKERLEVFGGGRIAIIDDFRRLELRAAGKRKRWRNAVPKKGFDEELEAFFSAVRDGGPMPVAFEDLTATARATFAIEAALRSDRGTGLRE